MAGTPRWVARGVAFVAAGDFVLVFDVTSARLAGGADRVLPAGAVGRLFGAATEALFARRLLAPLPAFAGSCLAALRTWALFAGAATFFAVVVVRGIAAGSPLARRVPNDSPLAGARGHREEPETSDAHDLSGRLVASYVDLSGNRLTFASVR